MKKIIYFCGIIALIIVILLNILFTANLNIDEKINIEFNNFFYIFGVIITRRFYIFYDKTFK
ncbi:MAG: hypothetical protein HFJ50_02455 [Clostridia bacterium]|nr:hypothetical protein [Clostridia bacterium]